jgi:hypothetical protein
MRGMKKTAKNKKNMKKPMKNKKNMMAMKNKVKRTLV